MLIDSHCHLDDFEDLPKILANAQAAGVGQLLAIGIGDGPATMHRALEFANTYPEVFASAGIHPQEAHQATPEALQRLAVLAADPRCIAVGEIGLDYYHSDNPDSDVQITAFVAQMRLAAEHRRPITIHCRSSELASASVKVRFGHRDANEDLLSLLAEHWQPTGLPGILHCFSGDLHFAKRALDLGFYLSFAGNLTYPKSVTLQQVARTAPANRLLVETDAPFLTPIPLRGQRNEPAHTALTAAFLADLRGVSAEDLAEQTTRNFHQLFPSTAT